jgi:coenzyme PQQ synthesis protein D (PqqD)
VNERRQKMPEEASAVSRQPFVSTELRPNVGPDLEEHPPLAPETPAAELGQRAGEALGKREGARLGLEDASLSPEMWQTRFARSAGVSSTVLDREAVLLNLENGVYYGLNRVGTAVWDMLKEEQPLEAVLTAVCDRYDVSEDVARADVAALVSQLREEGLVVERR